MGQRIQRRETGKAEKGQGAKDLEMHTQKSDLHSDGTCLGHHGAVTFVHFLLLITQIWQSSVQVSLWFLIDLSIKDKRLVKQRGPLVFFLFLFFPA